MSRRVVVVAVLLVVFLVAFILPFVQRARLNANLAASRYNLGQLAFFAGHNTNPQRIREADKIPAEIPAGTIVLPGVPVENRLSWAVPVLPWLTQKNLADAQLLQRIDITQPWSAERNQEAGRVVVPVFLCPGNTFQVPAGSPAITCYVGIAGLGPDAATLPLPANAPPSPRAGAFRYDAPTPFDRITDGLSQTLLMGETADSPGPWLRGGVSTVRGFDDAPGARPLIGGGGQFGGFFPGGANFALCDGSVRMFTPQTTPGVLLGMATIAGGANEIGPTD